MTYVTKIVSSPVGPLTLVAGDAGLTAVLWLGDRAPRVRRGTLAEDGWHPVLRQAEEQLADYFAGRRTRFDVPLDLAGTDFQKRVWAELLAIPFGATRTYGALASAIGSPKASRAVGAACGRNPVSIIVPCHRVVGADRSLTGFGGGLAAKRFLLDLESRQQRLAA